MTKREVVICYSCEASHWCNGLSVMPSVEFIKEFTDGRMITAPATPFVDAFICQSCGQLNATLLFRSVANKKIFQFLPADLHTLIAIAEVKHLSESSLLPILLEIWRKLNDEFRNALNQIQPSNLLFPSMSLLRLRTILQKRIETKPDNESICNLAELYRQGRDYDAVLEIDASHPEMKGSVRFNYIVKLAIERNNNVREITC